MCLHVFPPTVARQWLSKNLPIVARKQLGKNVTTAKHTNTKLEELLDASIFYAFFVVSRKVGN